LRQAASLLIFTFSLFAQVATDHYATNRDGSTASEPSLTVGGLNNFGKLGSFSCDSGAIYAQPLYLTGVTVSGVTYNLLIVATMHDNVCAFNADQPGTSALWTVSTGTSWTANQPPSTIGAFYGREIGCVSTPVTDTTNGYVYVLCAHNTGPIWRLWKIKLADGTTTNVTVTATVTGTGCAGGAADNVSGGNLTFYPQYVNARAGLTLANSSVYVATASIDDNKPWHGWLLRYDLNLNQTAAWNSTPSGCGGGIWQSGGGPAVDGSGNLYVVTGNGDYDGSALFAMSAVKLSPSLSVLDWYTPTNWSTLNATDIDLAGGRPMLIPGTNLLAWCSKDFNCYSVNTACMGHLGGTVGGCTAPQILATRTPPTGAQGGSYGNAFLNNTLYATITDINKDTLQTTPQSMYAFSLTGSTFNPTPTVSSAQWQFPGSIVSGTMTGSTNGILWAITVSNTTGNNGAWNNPQSATLRALNPADFSEYWNSGAAGANAPGQLAKFVQPTATKGRVFVATLDSGIAVYGTLPARAVGGGTVIK
jgi:hypothetical protein